MCMGPSKVFLHRISQIIEDLLVDLLMSDKRVQFLLEFSLALYLHSSLAVLHIYV